MLRQVSEARLSGSWHGHLRGWPGLARTACPVTAGSAAPREQGPGRVACGRRGALGVRRAWDGLLLGYCFFPGALRVGMGEIGQAREANLGTPLTAPAVTVAWVMCTSRFRMGPPLPRVCILKQEFNLVTFLFLVPAVVAALRTRRRGRARFKKPSSPRGQALRNARNAARTSGPTGKAAVAGPGAPQTRTFPAVWPRGGRSGAGPKSCARAARGRCGPRLRPRPCCGGPSNVPGHRRAAGAPALAYPSPPRFNSGKNNYIRHCNKTYSAYDLCLIALTFAGLFVSLVNI